MRARACCGQALANLSKRDTAAPMSQRKRPVLVTCSSFDEELLGKEKRQTWSDGGGAPRRDERAGQVLLLVCLVAAGLVLLACAAIIGQDRAHAAAEQRLNATLRVRAGGAVGVGCRRLRTPDPKADACCADHGSAWLPSACRTIHLDRRLRWRGQWQLRARSRRTCGSLRCGFAWDPHVTC